jgi:hypothetical protein
LEKKPLQLKKKEKEKDTVIWKDLPCSHIDRIMRMAILSKAICRFNVTHIKIPIFFTKIKIILKFI